MRTIKCVYLSGAIDVETRFHNCARKKESPIAPVPVLTEGIKADREHGNGFEQHGKQDSCMPELTLTSCFRKK